MELLAFVVGLVLLIAGAEAMVRGGSALAAAFGISPLVIGITVVAFGTSAPEVAISIGSTLNGRPDLAVGNIVGSNVFNVLFIVGLCALVVPLVVQRQLIRRDVPVMAAASVAVLAMGWDGRIGRIEGLVLFGGLVAYTALLVRTTRGERRAAMAATVIASPAIEVAAVGEAEGEGKDEAEDEAELVPRWPLWASLVALVVGLVVLVVGSELVVWAAVSVAESLGVSELVIGLTLVAAGTSLPEVATSVMATIRGQRDLALGNVVGSNLFNLLGALGLAAIVSPDGVEVARSIARFDLTVMALVAVACLPVFFSSHQIGRAEGALFFGYYIVFVVYLILREQDHPWASGFSELVVFVLAPLTVVGLAVAARRTHRLHGWEIP